MNNNFNIKIVGRTPKGTPIFEEPAGCVSEYSFVKSNINNNNAYIESAIDTYLATIPAFVQPFEEACLRLMAEIPEFNIVQIKEKFGSFRFYYDCDEQYREQADKIIENLEKVWNKLQYGGN